MPNLTGFNHHFFHALWKIRVIFFGLFALLVVNAAAVVISLRAAWTRVAVRVAGSWVAVRTVQKSFKES